jgi:hypothetical protein
VPSGANIAVATAEERMQVLKLVESGQLTAVEAVELLGALAQPAHPAAVSASPERGSAPSRMRLRVTDLITGHEKLDITLPWAIAGAGRRLGARFMPDDVEVNFDDVLRAVDAGAEGKVVEVIDDKEGERVEIFVN